MRRGTAAGAYATAERQADEGRAAERSCQAAQHVRRHEHHTFVSDVETRGIGRAIHTDGHAVCDFAALTKDRATHYAAASDFDVRKDDRALNTAALVHADIGEQ